MFSFLRIYTISEINKEMNKCFEKTGWEMTHSLGKFNPEDDNINLIDSSYNDKNWGESEFEKTIKRLVEEYDKREKVL